MQNNLKPTRKQFCIKFKSAQRLRHSDKMQFEILFNQWKRQTFGHI